MAVAAPEGHQKIFASFGMIPILAPRALGSRLFRIFTDLFHVKLGPPTPPETLERAFHVKPAPSEQRALPRDTHPSRIAVGAQILGHQHGVAPLGPLQTQPQLPQTVGGPPAWGTLPGRLRHHQETPDGQQWGATLCCGRGRPKRPSHHDGVATTERWVPSCHFRSLPDNFHSIAETTTLHRLNEKPRTSGRTLNQ